MSRTMPTASQQLSDFYSHQEEDVKVSMPPLDVQDRLVQLYFIYVHPILPVLVKSMFLDAYERRCAS